MAKDHATNATFRVKAVRISTYARDAGTTVPKVIRTICGNIMAAANAAHHPTHTIVSQIDQ
jgi:hypothetical protein